MVRPEGAGGDLVRSFVAGLLLVTLAGCSGTDSAPPQPSPPFEGTIGAAIWTEPVRTPLLVDAGSGEHMLPVDLTWISDGVWEEEYWRRAIGRDYDISRDGKYLYTAVRSYIIRFSLPVGGQPEYLAYAGITHNVKVSPSGEWLVFQQLVEGNRLILMRADGTGEARVIHAPPVVAGVGYQAPVWITDDHLMVPVTRSALEPPYGWVLELKAPHWIPTEYEPLRIESREEGRIGISLRSLTASPDGKDLYLFRGSNTPQDPREIVRYPLGQFLPEVKVTLPINAGGVMAISPDGRQVATVTQDGMAIYDLGSGELVTLLGGGDPNRVPWPVAWVARKYP